MAKDDETTLSDIARHTGVSKMTVSRALRTPEKVAAKTRERIMRAVSDRNFAPSRLAVGLAGGRTGLVAAIVPTILTATFATALRGLDAALSANSQALLIGQTEYRPEVEELLVRAYVGWRPDGIVLTGGVHTPELETLLRRTGTPVAEMWTLRRDPIGAAIGFSNRDAFFDLARSLIAAGYRRPGFVGRDANSDARMHERLRGYRDALAEAGIEPRVVLEKGDQSVVRAGGIGFEKLVTRWPDSDVAMFASDTLALGGRYGCMRRGLRVPDDIALTGFGDLELGAEMEPGLTTITPPGERIGLIAANWIHGKLPGARGSAVVDVGYALTFRGSAPIQRVAR